jgi:hypothetical protein
MKVPELGTIARAICCPKKAERCKDRSACAAHETTIWASAIAVRAVFLDAQNG